ncbi:hypothetical protein K1W54_22775 [Micromonospora sp. CPCC 205371]|nr:hypothetical protein [Micromonospora sp. CPCC 205371]
MPDGAAGGSPWAADGPAGAWWRGDPAAAAARFAALDRPAVPPVPPAPIVTIPPPPDAAASAGEAVHVPHAAPVGSLPSDYEPADADERTAGPEADAEVIRPEVRAVREPTPTGLRPADGFDPTPQAASRQPDSEPVDTAASAPAGHDESPEQAGEPGEPSLDAAEAAPGDSPPEDDAERAAGRAGASADRATEGSAAALGAPAALADAEPDEAPSIDAASDLPDIEAALPEGDTISEPDAAVDHAATLSGADTANHGAALAQADATHEGDATHEDGALDDVALQEAAIDGSMAGDEAGFRADVSADEATRAATAVEAGLADDGAAQPPAPVLRPGTPADASGRPWRARAPIGAPRRHRLAAEARETVVLPPMPERALIPTPSPAPDDDELPFWLPSHEVPRRDRYSGRRPGRLPKPPRSPAVGLVGLVVLALLATFFAWVSAEPLWLAVGHGDSGTATISECTGSGVGQRCVGEFSAANGAFTAEGIRLVGVADGESTAGSTVTARMVGADSGRAYVGDAAAVRHLRWALGLILVMLCGLGLVWVTGARRLEDRWSRRTATVTALAAPLLVTVAFLASTF